MYPQHLMIQVHCHFAQHKAINDTDSRPENRQFTAQQHNSEV